MNRRFANIEVDEVSFLELFAVVQSSSLDEKEGRKGKKRRVCRERAAAREIQSLYGILSGSKKKEKKTKSRDC